MSSNKYRNALDTIRENKKKLLDKKDATNKLNVLKKDWESQKKTVKKTFDDGNMTLAKTQFAIAVQMKSKIDEVERVRALDQLADILNENNSNSNGDEERVKQTQIDVNNSINPTDFESLVNNET